MTLLLNNEDVRQVLTADLALPALEEAFREEGNQAAGNRTKSHIHIPSSRPGHWYRFRSMEGGLREKAVLAMRIKSEMVHWPTRFGKRRQEVYSVTPDRHSGLVLLFSAEDGDFLAIMNDGVLQRMRVGATAALAAREMARPDGDVLGVLGSGGQARSHALAYTRVRRIRRIRVYSPNPEHRREFAREIADSTGVEVVPCPDPASAVSEVDILACCTSSAEPVVDPAWIRPGMHLTSVMLPELPGEAYSRIDRAVTYRSDVAQNSFTTPEDWRPPSLGGSTPQQLAKLELIPKRVSLCDVLLGRAAGRESAAEINYFNSEGTGVQFAAVALAVYEKARDRGLGRELPGEWFLQDVRS